MYAAKVLFELKITAIFIYGLRVDRKIEILLLLFHKLQVQAKLPQIVIITSIFEEGMVGKSSAGRVLSKLQICAITFGIWLRNGFDESRLVLLRFWFETAPARLPGNTARYNRM